MTDAPLVLNQAECPLPGNQSDGHRLEAPDAVETGARRDQGRSEWHRCLLWLTVAVIVLALVLKVRPDQRVVVPGFEALPIPETCGMRILFQRNCPGCGLTRSFIHLAHGDWVRSMMTHRLGWLIAAAVALQIPYRLLAMQDPSRTLSRPWAYAILAGLGTVLVINWLLMMLPSAPQ